jgi:hypothetical protein
MFHSSRLFLSILLTLLCVVVVYSGRLPRSSRCEVDGEEITIYDVMKSADEHLENLKSIAKYYQCLNSVKKPGDLYDCHIKKNGKLYGYNEFVLPEKIHNTPGYNYACHTNDVFQQWKTVNYYKIWPGYVVEKVEEDRIEKYNIRQKESDERYKERKEYIMKAVKDFIGLFYGGL